MPRRYWLESALFALLLLITAVLFFSTIRPGHDWGGDFSMYIIHARNLAQGRPYLDTGFLLDAEIPPMAPPAYPPLLPLLLAPLYKYYGLDYGVFKMMVQLLFLAGFLLTYLLARMRVGPWAAIVVVAVFAWSGIVLMLKESVLSESAYLMFAGATLLCALWIYRKKWDEVFPVSSALALTLLVLLSYATRIVGGSLILALFAYEATVVRRLRRFNISLLVALSLGMWVYTGLLYDGRGYGNQFSFTPRIYVENVFYYLRAPASLWPHLPRLIRWPLTGTFIVLSGWGFLRSMKRPTVLEFYIVASLMPLIVYSSGRIDRYLMPVLPFLPLYAAESIGWLRTRIPPAWGRMAAAGAIGTALFVGCFNIAQMDRGPITEGIAKPSFAELARFIKSNTPSDGRIIFWNPRVLALYTDRASSWYTFVKDTDRFLQFVSRMRMSHMILYRLNEDDTLWLRPHLERRPERFRLLFRNSDFELYQIVEAN